MEMKKNTIKPPPLPKGFRSLRAEKNTKEGISKPEIYDDRPTICFSESELPQIDEWKNGEIYEVTIRIEQTGSRICDYGKNKGKNEATFRVDAVRIGETSEKKEEKKK